MKSFRPKFKRWLKKIFEISPIYLSNVVFLNSNGYAHFITPISLFSLPVHIPFITPSYYPFHWRGNFKSRKPNFKSRKPNVPVDILWLETQIEIGLAARVGMQPEEVVHQVLFEESIRPRNCPASAPEQIRNGTAEIWSCNYAIFTVRVPSWEKLNLKGWKKSWSVCMGFRIDPLNMFS